MAREAIDRSRFGDQVLARESLYRSFAQAERTGRQQRNSHDVAEDRAILAPADPGSRRVFRHENLLKASGRDTL
jgi:hypothetical protein